MIKLLTIAAALTASCLTAAQAGVILSAESAQVIVGGPGSGVLSSTHDQEGLGPEYESDVTDFDAYIASEPLHDNLFSTVEGGTTYYSEWFSQSGTTAATVVYDLGQIRQTLGLALWNEDANGIGKLNILGSIDNQNWMSFATNLTPTDNAKGVDYGAEVFSWAENPARYIKLEMSQCKVSNAYTGCSVGEVAFHVTAVPEPSSFAMAGLGLGLAAFAAARRRRKQG